MNTLNKLSIVTLFGSLAISISAVQGLAQKSNSEALAGHAFLTDDGSAASSALPQAPSSQAPQPASTKVDEGWHWSVSPYLWFAGIHGTVGSNGRDVSVHASFSDIFHNLNIGLMGVVEPQYKRFGAPVDFLWMKLSDDKGLPFQVGPTSIKVELNQTMLTPKVSYRIVDGELVKVDGNFGIRYFHLGTTLKFEPSGFLPSFYQSENWVDYVTGARIIATPAPKIMVTIAGDVGAGGSDLDYQVAGFLGYKVKPNIILQAGYRYLDVDYRPKSTFVYDTATSGLILGATFNLK